MKNTHYNFNNTSNKEDEDYVGAIDILNRSYHHHKMLLFENDNGLCNHLYYRVMESRRVVSRLENALDVLPDKVRLIINAEVIENKKGTKWYTQYFTTPTYYRNRKVAYKMYIDLINK